MSTYSRRQPLWLLLLGIFVISAIGESASLAGQDLIAHEMKTTTISRDNAEHTSLPTITFAPVVQKVMPSVVNIFSSRKIKTDFRNDELFNEEPIFRKFFGDQFGGR